MSRFTKFTAYKPLPDGKRWVLNESLTYELGEIGSGNVIIVPQGFITDFASIPRLFRNIFGRWGKYGNAAVLHDWLYWEQYSMYNRKKSDNIFLEAMKVLNVPKTTRYCIYWAVRIFGFMAWNGNRKDKDNGVTRIIIF